MVFGYLWACVVSLFQVIIVVNSSDYRTLYGDDPLKIPSKQAANERAKKVKIENVKFYPSPDFHKNTDRAKVMAKLNRYTNKSYGANQPQRVQNEYIEMRRKYLNQSDYGHGQRQENGSMNSYSFMK